MTWREYFRSLDYVLILAVLVLSAFGVVMIFSATHSPNTPLLVTRNYGGLWRNQLMFLVTGTAMLLAFSRIDYRWISKYYLYIYALMIVLLVLVLIIGGDDGTGTVRWFRFDLPGIGSVGIQPSEFSKIFIMVFLAKLLDVKQDRFNFIGWLAVIGASVALPLILVMRQNALSATLVILVISLTIIFVGGLYYRTILIGAGVAIPIALIIWFDLQRNVPLFMDRILQPYQLLRIRTALDPYAAHPDHLWQLDGSLYAIGTAGLTGHGFMQHPHVVLGHNDFIFSVIAAQFGFIGATILLGVLALVIIKCILIALRAEDRTGRLIAAGTAGMLIFEAFVHVGVGTGLLPVTGMPLPFISSGGSMVWGHMIAMGLVLNVALPRKKGMFGWEGQGMVGKRSKD